MVLETSRTRRVADARRTVKGMVGLVGFATLGAIFLPQPWAGICGLLGLLAIWSGAAVAIGLSMREA